MPAIGTLAPRSCAERTKGKGHQNGGVALPPRTTRVPAGVGLVTFGIECLKVSELDRRRGSGISGAGGRRMGIRLTSRRVLAGYAAWMALLVVAHYTLAWQRTGTAALIEVSGVAAMVAGVYINRPARRTPWLLLAAANLTGTVGEVASRVFATVTHAPAAVPVVRRCHLPGGLPAVRGRARDVHPVAVHRAGRAQRDRRARPHGRPDRALLGIPRHARRDGRVADRGRSGS